jgi:maltooligosyltrehalose trehalohydrolase
MNVEEATSGAINLGERRVRFRIWAPKRRRVSVHWVAPQDRLVRMEEVGDGYFEAVVEGIDPGARYFYRLDNQIERPDPASRFQPDGVHAASEIVDSRFSWTDDAWRGRPLTEYIRHVHARRNIRRRN